MGITSKNVWFACKLCRGSFFNKIHQFIKHKKEFHPLEFESITCIIFDERTTTENCSGPSPNDAQCLLNSVPEPEPVPVPDSSEDLKPVLSADAVTVKEGIHQTEAEQRLTSTSSASASDMSKTVGSSSVSSRFTRSKAQQKTENEIGNNYCSHGTSIQVKNQVMKTDIIQTKEEKHVMKLRKAGFNPLVRVNRLTRKQIQKNTKLKDSSLHQNRLKRTTKENQNEQNCSKIINKKQSKPSIIRSSQRKKQFSDSDSDSEQLRNKLEKKIASVKLHQEFHLDIHQNYNNSAKILVSAPPPQPQHQPPPQPQSQSQPQPQPQPHCSNNISIMDFKTFLLKSRENLKNQEGLTVTTSLSNLILKREACSAAENCEKSGTAPPNNAREHMKQSHRSHSSAVDQPMPSNTNTNTHAMTMKHKKQKIKQNSVKVEKHIEVNTWKPKFECANCSKKFLFKSWLELHALVHTDKKPFVCSFEGCATAYKRISDLKKHERGRHGVVKEKKKYSVGT